MSEQLSEADLKAQKKGRRTLLTLLAVSVMPIAAAYFVFFTGVGLPTNTVNAGVLLEKTLSLQAILPEDAWQEISENKKWRLLVPIGKTCNEQCEKNLYTSRQVHVRLGEKSVRVGRLAVNFGDEAGREYLAQIQEDHPLLKSVEVPAATWQQWVSQSRTIEGLNGEPFYMLVDQEGLAMMVYTNAQHGNELLKDIKRALKFSIDYQ